MFKNSFVKTLNEIIYASIVIHKLSQPFSVCKCFSRRAPRTNSKDKKEEHGMNNRSY